MPKQGQFARLRRIKQLNNFKVKSHQRGQTIAEEQLTDFLVVRYALTVKKRVPTAAQETMQRLLIEISDQLVKQNGNLKTILPALLVRINSRVPWQFFKQVVAEWELLQKFLQKELPAVPLQRQLRITSSLSLEELKEAVAKLLATKTAAITFVNQPKLAATMTDQTARLLLPTIYHDGAIDWSKVAALLSPFPFNVDCQLDSETQKWLAGLSMLK